MAKESNPYSFYLGYGIYGLIPCLTEQNALAKNLYLRETHLHKQHRQCPYFMTCTSQTNNLVLNTQTKFFTFKSKPNSITHDIIRVSILTLLLFKSTTHLKVSEQ